MSYRAPLPSQVTYPSAALYPAVPNPAEYETTLVGSNGTTVPILAVLDASETHTSNTIIHNQPAGAPLIDIRPWTPPTISIRFLVRDMATFAHIKTLYASGARVTVADAGGPYNGHAHILSGTLTAQTIARPGLASIIEARAEVTPS